MFLDASAVLAILLVEPGHEVLLERALTSPTDLTYSAMSRFEAVVGFARNRAGPHRSSTAAQIEEARELVDDLLAELKASCVDLTEPIGTGALTAAQTYGRAVGHAAGLNLGDCFAYACAKEIRVGLLYKGDDFARTDLG
jgi:ribonuclease VapC